MDINEFQIPVPWGHIAVKSWGNEKNTPVVALHGWYDNAGTFDRLIPHLPNSYFYICIDLPSHGKSSHYPPHVVLESINNVVAIKLVVDFLKREKYILMAHSWGGLNAIFFAQLYPEYILKLVLFDAFYFVPKECDSFKDNLKDTFETVIRINDTVSKYKQVEYTYEEAIAKLIDGRQHGQLLKVSAEVLAKRSLISNGNGKFRFSTDPRLKVIMNPIFGMEFSIKLAEEYPITCPALLIYASESIAKFDYFKNIIDVFQQKNKRYLVQKVEGGHDVHINNPEVVAPFVNKFLINSSKL